MKHFPCSLTLRGFAILALSTSTALAAGPPLLDDGSGAATPSILIEAESNLAAPFEVGTNPTIAAEASGGSYLQTTNPGGQSGQPTTGLLSYNFSLLAGGDVAIWARVWTPDPGSDRFWYRFDNAPSWTIFAPPQEAGWRWHRVAVEQLEAGPHTIGFSHLEDGGLVDAFVVASDLNLVPGNALQFSGDRGNRNRVDVAGAIPLGDALTIEAWVNLRAAPGGDFDPIVSKGNEVALLRFEQSDKIVFRTGDDDLVTLSVLTPGQWHHVAAVIENGEKRLYLDGVLDRSSRAGALDPGPAPLRFGGNFQETGGVFGGSLDEVRIWSVARSVAELVGFGDQHLTGEEAGLEGWWSFNESGITAADGSPHGRDGTLVGFSRPSRINGLELTGPSLAMRFGQALDAGRHLSVDPAAPVESQFRFTDAMTVEFWLRFDAPPLEGGTTPLVSKGAPWNVFLDPVGRVVFETDGHFLAGDTVLAPGEWHHIAATLEAVDDPGAGTVLRKTIYLDGGPDGSADVAAVSLTTDTTPVTVGGDGSRALLGSLDEIRIWGRALPGHIIAIQHTRNLNGREPGLLLLWRLDFAEALARNSALNGPGSRDIDGSLEDLTELDFVPGVPLGPPPPPQNDLFFDGVSEFVSVPDDPSLNFSPALTIEVWVKPEAQEASTVLVKGSDGYGIGLDSDLRPVFFGGPTAAELLGANQLLTVGEWFHIAVVVEEAPGGGPNGTTTFYINGEEAGTRSIGQIANNAQPLFIGQGGAVFAENFHGEIDEVRLWGTAINPAQIRFLAQVPLPDGGAGLPGLTAYWGFDEGTGSSTGGGLTGTLNAMDETNWRFGHDFGVPRPDGGLNLQTDPGAKGLWIGQVSLGAVNEAAALDPQALTPTGDTANVRLILHVDSDGTVKMLKDVIVMKQRDDPQDENSPTSVVLVTDPTLIPNFEGVVERSGKLVGLRYGSAAYDFEGLELPMLGGLGASLGCAGAIVLGTDHPTNPYRHKFHPRHAEGYRISRSISIEFDGDPGDPLGAAPGFGVSRITGIYRETVTGLHKLPIRVAGRLELSRISTVGVLNEKEANDE